MKQKHPQTERQNLLKINFRKCILLFCILSLFGMSAYSIELEYDNHILDNPSAEFTVEIQDPIKVTGTVTDENNIPLPAVNISISGTSKGTSTNFDGIYEIEVEKGQKLIFSSVGFESQTITVRQDTEINVTMQEGSVLDEVVVVGYGTQKKANLTGAVDNVGQETFEKRSVSNVTQALEGAIPNLNLDLADGKPTRSASFNIRGQTSIGQGGSALVLIDGV